jgi:hypothetical protein
MAEKVLASDFNELQQRLSDSRSLHGQYASQSSQASLESKTSENISIMEQNVHKLRFKLLTISELYHEICVPYKLWDISLLLLHASKSGEAELIAKLWRSFIYR